VDQSEGITIQEPDSLMNKITGCMESNNDNAVVEALKKVVDSDLGVIAKEILDKQAFSGKKGEKFTEGIYHKNIRGMFFEHLALRYMEEKGEPEDPFLSNLILGISRDPKGFLSVIYGTMLKEYNLENNPGKKDQLLSDMRKVKNEIEDPGLPNFPSNNDAIAIQTVNNHSELKVTVVGSIEVKGYNFIRSKYAEDVMNQLSKSKHDTVNVLDKVLKYLPYYLNSKNNNYEFRNIDIVSEDDFQQTLVQPNVYKGENDTDKLSLESQGFNVEIINITTEQIANISKVLAPEIRKEMIKAQRFGYKPKVK
jgi:hypothetical protein